MKVQYQLQLPRSRLQIKCLIYRTLVLPALAVRHLPALAVHRPLSSPALAGHRSKEPTYLVPGILLASAHDRRALATRQRKNTVSAPFTMAYGLRATGSVPPASAVHRRKDMGSAPSKVPLPQALAAHQHKDTVSGTSLSVPPVSAVLRRQDIVSAPSKVPAPPASVVLRRQRTVLVHSKVPLPQASAVHRSQHTVSVPLTMTQIHPTSRLVPPASAVHRREVLTHSNLAMVLELITKLLKVRAQQDAVPK